MAACWRVYLLVAICLTECRRISGTDCKDPSTGEITSAGEFSVNSMGMHCYCPEDVPPNGEFQQPDCAFLEDPYTPQAGCLVEGKVYFPDEWFQPNPCTYCHCRPQSVTADCVPVDCIPAPCPNPIVNNDTCCPSCPNGPACLGLHGDEIPAGRSVTYADGTQCTCARPLDVYSWEPRIDLTPLCAPSPPRSFP